MPHAATGPEAGAIRHARADSLDLATFYALLRLRVDVFVVEQQCPYAELDGDDLGPGTEHWWVESDGAVLATLRVLSAGEQPRIGRVATAGLARGRGYAGMLMAAALDSLDAAGVTDVTLEAQAHLQRWYARFGFAPTGQEYLEDGIPHVSMARHSPLRGDHDQGRGGG
jgi:ElaA protein